MAYNDCVQDIATRLRPTYGDRIVDRALNRLQHGDVTATAYGIRVALRSDLGDDRSGSGATAYWPYGNGTRQSPFRCVCRGVKRNGVCSHAIAAHIFRLQHGMKDQRHRQYSLRESLGRVPAADDRYDDASEAAAVSARYGSTRGSDPWVTDNSEGLHQQREDERRQFGYNLGGGGD